MPQLDIYRAFDEILLILLLVIAVYLLMLFIVLPLIIKRIAIRKSQEEIRKIEIWNKQMEILIKNLKVVKEEKNNIKI